MVEGAKGLAETIENGIKYPLAICVICFSISLTGYLYCKSEIADQRYKHAEIKIELSKANLDEIEASNHSFRLEVSTQEYIKALEVTSSVSRAVTVAMFISFFLVFVAKCIEAVCKELPKNPQKRSISWRLPRNKPPS